MSEILKSSIIYNLFASAGNWFSKQFDESRLIGRFLTDSNTADLSEGSIFSRIFELIVKLFRVIFEKLRLTKLFDGSIFKMPFLWCFLAFVFSPVLPTMVVLALALVGFGSLLLKLFCEKNFKLKHNALNKFVLIYALVYFISTFTSVNVRGSLQ